MYGPIAQRRDEKNWNFLGRVGDWKRNQETEGRAIILGFGLTQSLQLLSYVGKYNPSALRL